MKNATRSSAWVMAEQVWRILSRIILTPLIIYQIGLEGYATWTLLFSMLAYLTMFETSFGHAYSKYTAELDTTGDYEGLGQIVGSGMVLTGLLSLLAGGALYLVRGPVLRLLNVPDALLDDASVALLLVMICVAMHLSVGCVYNILTGLQRVDLHHKIRIVASAIEFVVALVMLQRGHGLLALAWGHVAGTTGGVLIAWRLCRRHAPDLRITPLAVSRQGLGAITSLGGRFQILMVLNLFRLQGVKLIIAAVGGVAVLGIYELAFKMLSLAISLPRAVIAPMMPAFASLLAEGREARLRPLLRMAQKILGVAALLPLAFLAVFAEDVLRLWVGETFPLAAWSLRVLLVGVFMQQMTGVASSLLRAQGVLRYEFQAQLLTVVLLGVAIVPVGIMTGYQGMVVTIMLSQVIGYGWFLLRFNRLEELSLRSLIRDALALPALTVIPLAVLMAVMATLYFPEFAKPERWQLAGWLALYGSLFTLMVTLLGWRLALNRVQRSQLIAMFKTDERGGPVNHPAARVGA